MPRGRPRRQPSGRNLELYHELVCEGRLQAEVAARFRVSQPRVAQLRRQIAAWVESSLPADIRIENIASILPLPPGEGRSEGVVSRHSRQNPHPNPLPKGEGTVPCGPGDAGRRLHLAIALRRLQLEDAYGKYLDHFGGASGAAGYGHLLAASATGVLPNEMAARLPPRALVQSAVRMGRELDDLARIAHRGPFFHLPDQLRELCGAGVPPAHVAETATRQPVPA